MGFTNYVEPLLFGYMFCIFLTIPVEQQLVYKKLCLQHFNHTYCDILHNSNDKNYTHDQDMIQEETAQWGIYLDVSRTIPALVSTTFFGAWSDRIGRKTVMILPLIGDLLQAIGYLLNAYFLSAPIPFLFFGAIISAIFGNFATILLATFSYIADVSSEASRTKRVTILESMIYLGGAGSNLVGGWLLQKEGFVAVFSLVTAFFVAQLIYWFFLKESYEPVIETQGKVQDLFNAERMKEALHVITVKRRGRFRITLYMLLCCFFIFILFFVGLNSISILYLLHQPLEFSPSKIGYFLAEVNGVKFIGATFVNFFLIYYLQWSDYSVTFLAAIMYCGFTLSLAFSKMDWQVYLAVLWCFGLGTGSSSVRSALSKMVSAEEQGKLFSVVACVEVLVALIGGTMFSAVYKKTVSISPSFSFYLMAGLSSIPIGLSILLKVFGQKRFYEELHKETSTVEVSINSPLDATSRNDVI